MRHGETAAVELNVPTPSKPARPAAEVSCVRCACRVRFADADVVGLGYRCRRCSLLADIDELTGSPDVVDHLVVADRERFARRGREMAVQGAIVSAVLALIAIVVLAVAPAASRLGIKVLFFALMVLLGVGGLGLEHWRRFRIR